MLGTIVNTAAVIAGSLLGMLITALTKTFQLNVSERFSKRIMQALGLCTLYIGISGALAGENTLILILSMVIGTLIGEALDLDEKINRLGDYLEKRFQGTGKDGKKGIAEGFVSHGLHALVCSLFQPSVGADIDRGDIDFCYAVLSILEGFVGIQAAAMACIDIRHRHQNVAECLKLICKQRHGSNNQLLDFAGCVKEIFALRFDDSCIYRFVVFLNPNTGRSLSLVCSYHTFN